MSKLIGAIALVTLAVAGTTAQAQVAGTYTGTTSEGGLAQITVADDGSGQLVFSGDAFQWTMSCTSGDSKDTWWGVGQSVPIVSKKTMSETKLPYLYEKVTLKFSADNQTVTGTFNGSEPTYIDIDTSRKVENCISNKLTYTATLGTPSAQAVNPAYQSLKIKRAD